MEVMAALEEALAEITGMDAVTLQPAAGAHGELTGILLIRALLEARGNPRKKILIPDSAHGTNPGHGRDGRLRGREHHVQRTAAWSTSKRSNAPSNEDVAALMVTNPNTSACSRRTSSRSPRSCMPRARMLYMDGANMNALVGIARPGDFGIDVMHLNLHKTFSTPHGGGGPGAGPVAVKKILEPFLPTAAPEARRARSGRWDYDRPQSIGRVRAFYGNFGVLVRALAYILAHGGDGLAQRDRGCGAERQLYPQGSSSRTTICLTTRPTCTKCVFSDDRQAKLGVRTGDIAKRLIDYGFHPYTVSFPLIVHGALMIEPTETEGKRELDLFIDAMISIAKEVESRSADGAEGAAPDAHQPRG